MFTRYSSPATRHSRVSLRSLKATVAVLPLAIHAAPALAGEVTGFVGVTRDGYVFADPAEGIDPPGIKAVTDGLNTEYSGIVGDSEELNQFAPRGVPNCLMANAPEDISCDAPPGSGKRYKTWMTGPDGFDLNFTTRDSGGTSEYFNFGKTTNMTGARVTGFTIQIGTGTGADFIAATADSGVVFDELEILTDAEALAWPGGATEGQVPLQRAFLPGGLFGDGGHEGLTGFFDEDRGVFVLTQNATNTVLSTGALVNDTHVALFGEGLIARNQIPDGYFWDDNDDPDDESALVAWNNPSNGGWTYGHVGPAGSSELDARLAELAEALGVSLADLEADYSPGDLVGDDVLAALEAGEAFTVDVIEDLSNLNLNFSVDVGDNGDGGFTYRITPQFAPIVEAAGNDLQFNVAGALDAANIPYLDADPAYLALISDIEALGTEAEQREALTQLGLTTAAGSFGAAFALAQDQFFALPGPAPEQEAGAVSTSGIAPAPADTPVWSINRTTRGFASFVGGRTTFDATASNPGFTADTASGWAGMEKALNGYSLGAMVGAGTSDTDIAGGFGSVETDNLGIGLFARSRIGQNGHIQAMLGYQDLQIETQRNVGIAGTTARGDTDGSVLVAGVEGDWMYNTGGFRLGPTASVRYYDVSIDGYTETGAGAANLTVGDQDTDFTLASVGARLERSFGTAAQPVEAYASASITKRSGGDAVIPTSFGGLPAFSTPVDDMDDTWVDLGVGVSTVVSQNNRMTTRIGADYRGAFFADGYESHGVRLFLSTKF